MVVEIILDLRFHCSLLFHICDQILFFQDGRRGFCISYSVLRLHSGNVVDGICFHRFVQFLLIPVFSVIRLLRV